MLLSITLVKGLKRHVLFCFCFCFVFVLGGGSVVVVVTFAVLNKTLEKKGYSRLFPHTQNEKKSAVPKFTT